MDGMPSASDLKALRQGLSADPHRPRYHFTPPANWLNDPNGLIEWRGSYHLFYQYNPNGPFHGTIHWGHAVSEDLLRWDDLPIALAPTPGGPDWAGCWSGCAVDANGAPTILYTGDSPQAVCLATGSPDLVQWTKPPGNPVIAGPPAEIATATRGDFRDPFVWRDDVGWHMVIGARLEGQGGAVLRYRSLDLRTWTYEGPLLIGDLKQSYPFHSGSVWECPNFIPLGDEHVLIISIVSVSGRALHPVFFAGAFDGQRFEPRAQGVLVHGASHYAPQVMRLTDGRSVLFGWLREERPQAALTAAGWAGAMSLPMTLTLLPDGGVGLAPVEELKSLRRAHHRAMGVDINAGTFCLLPDVRGAGLEIEAVFQASLDANFGLSLCMSPDGQEQTRLRYDGGRQLLSVEAAGVSATQPGGPERHAPLALGADGLLRLHLFLDQSVLEVFANGHTCLAARMYLSRVDSVAAGLFCDAGRVRLRSLDAWNLEV